MKDQLISFETAKLAKEKGFDELCLHFYCKNSVCNYLDKPYEYNFRVNANKEEIHNRVQDNFGYGLTWSAPTQALLQRFIRETRRVHIEIHRNASGYYWSMCMSDGGTNLGWSNMSGPNDSGVWDSFEDALENALQVQLSYDLPNDTKVIKHWGNYVEFALKNK